MGKVWRPALRCDSAYRGYIDSLNEVTSLDKNQIMRLMMFVAAHSNEFQQILSEYKRADVNTLPGPPWEIWEDVYWLNQTYQPKKPNVNSENIDIHTIKIKSNRGVIKFQL